VGDVLTKEEVAYFRERGGSTCAENVLELCDSHETLRAEVERLTKERAALVVYGNAALARAEEAEAELAEARRRAALDEAQCDEMTGMAGKLAERAEKAERDLARIKAWSDATISAADEACKAMMRERDEARRMYCVEACARSEEDFTPRMIAEDVYPDVADSLFPVEVKP